MLTVKANRLKLAIICNQSPSIEMFRNVIMGLRKGDTAEIVGEFHVYKTVRIHKNNKVVNLTDDEIRAIFNSHT